MEYNSHVAWEVEYTGDLYDVHLAQLAREAPSQQGDSPRGGERGDQEHQRKGRDHGR